MKHVQTVQTVQLTSSTIKLQYAKLNKERNTSKSTLYTQQ